jgi:predicted peroxiredoxin
MNTQNSQPARYFYALTTFEQDPDRVAVPIVLANAALASGQDVMLWLTLDGVKLALRGAADDMVSPSFDSIKELLDIYKEAGGKIGVCPACAKTHGLTESNMAENAVWMGAMAVQAYSQNHHMMSF